MNKLKHFVLWLAVPVEDVTHRKILAYIGHLVDKRLAPKTVNCHLDSIRGFYDYLRYEEEICLVNPVRRGYVMRLSRPLPRHLRDEQVVMLLAAIHSRRDQAMFRLMLRSGLRVEEVANLTLRAIDVKRRRVYVEDGKGAKGRVVYISDDALKALGAYLRVRPSSRAKKVFLVEKGPFRGRPISVRGIQKRIEYYAKKTGLKVSCHHLRHTMASRLLEAGIPLETISGIMGHISMDTTRIYTKVNIEALQSVAIDPEEVTHA